MTFGNIVGWCGIFGFVLALIAVVGILELKNRVIPQGQELLAAVTNSEFKVDPDDERIVMQFDPRRISQPDTFEYVIWKIKNTCPKDSFYHNSFLRDPRSVINRAEARLESSLILVAGMALFVAALGILSQFGVHLLLGVHLFPTETSKTVDAPVDFVYVAIAFLMFISVIIVFFKIMLYGPWKARTAAIEYVTYLAKNNIRIGFEFTKLRRAPPLRKLGVGLDARAGKGEGVGLLEKELGRTLPEVKQESQIESLAVDMILRQAKR